MLKYIAFILILVASHTSIAQSDWVLTNKRDTLRGKVTVSLGGKYATDEVIIKIDKKKTRLKSYQVAEVHINKEMILEPVKIDGRIQFAHLLNKGVYISWYRYVDVNNGSSQYSLNLLVKQDGEQGAYGSIGFKKRISSYLVACKLVSSKVEEGELGIKQMNQIVDEYNACLTNMKPSVTRSEDVIETALDDFIVMIKDSALSGNTDLISMLDDANQKLKHGKEIPGYLVQGIIKALQGEEKTLEQFQECLEE